MIRWEKFNSNRTIYFVLSILGKLTLACTAVSTRKPALL